ncbi:MAG: NAD(P)-binding domain-containing protein [Myxococcaceae bacterium]|nr:NAD(P)-binding domain-containing protein [Myxococcaceae bacterium]
MPQDNARPRLGFIGLGTMGSRMCQRLLAAGSPLTVLNRTRARAEPLLGQGATWASTPKELAARSDVVLSALLGTGLQALAEAIVLGERAGLEKTRLLEVLGQTAVARGRQQDMSATIELMEELAGTVHAPH